MFYVMFKEQFKRSKNQFALKELEINFFIVPEKDIAFLVRIKIPFIDYISDGWMIIMQNAGVNTPYFTVYI